MTRNMMGYQSAHTRRYKKLFGQTSWFTKKKEDHPKEAPEKESPKVPQKKRKRPRTGDQESSESKEKVVLFIPHTFRGELKDMLQEMERDMKGDKVKYVEMVGQSIGSQLVQQDPWKMHCGRESCLTCLEQPGACMKKGVVYKYTCQICRNLGRKME